MNDFVLRLDDENASIARVGGKGASLAKLVQNGLPVPPGFHVPTDVYRRFIETTGLQEKIAESLASASSANPGDLEGIENKVADWFAHEDIPADAADAIRQAYAAMGDRIAVAVRSSATAEDLPGMSFAGQQQSFLNIRGGDDLMVAIKRCWASLWTARAIQYRARSQVDHATVAMAVVVQELVPADAAGILFTADPVSGARGQLHINAAFGLGEAVVGGDVSPDTIVVDKSKMVIERQSVASKSVMTVRTDKGTETVPVPEDKRNVAVLGSEEALVLARFGVRIEALWGEPVDIEWARAGDSFFIVQARPITGLLDEPVALLSWNDSLRGDYLWTSANLGEAIPDVMTPCTWSIVERFMQDAMFSQFIVGHPLYGNIGGRFYMNLSVMEAMAAAFGMKSKIDEATEQVFGRLPAGLEMPIPKLSWWRLLKELVPAAYRARKRVRENQAEIPLFLEQSPKHNEVLREAVRKAQNGGELVQVWNHLIEPFFRKACQMLQAAGKQDGTALIEVRKDLRKRVGETDANTLLTGLQSGGNELASLGPLIGLTRVERGELSREEYALMYGHRGAHEFEVAMPRPAEDPEWIDKQVAGIRQAKEDLATLLARKQMERNAAWARLEARSPREVAKIKQNVARWANVARSREFARSESIRCFWVARAFVLRAGELSGYGADLFFLTIDEILALLAGDPSALEHVPARRATHAAYSALPPYPTLIRGAFDPFVWARETTRRSDLFDATATAPPASATITGFPGATGIVEGLVRVLATPEEGESFQSGEILVTTVTNIGWTPLFPRAAAVITDVGAPLSHAAIVARELGIPAVVGCGNAMMRLHTGDRVRVDGARGVVELLQRAGTT